jgi:SAM-dependent methyltransferase
MHRPFPLFQSHLDLAKQYWTQLIHPGDSVIDATCGNGHDTLFLAERVLTPEMGIVYSMDIQEAAIEKARQKIVNSLPVDLQSRVRFILGSHCTFPKEILPLSVALLVYNLGYLPGGSKTLTTELSSTMQSIQAALPLIKEGGAISITCYPGHSEGKKEEAALLAYAENLDKKMWSCCFHQWINRREAPSLMMIQKSSVAPS